MSQDANHFPSGARYLMEQIRLYIRFAGPDSVYVDDYFGDVKGLKAFTSDLVDRVVRNAWLIAGRPSALVLKSPELSFYIDEAVEVLNSTTRFIYSVREPKDTIASMITAGDRQRSAGIATMLAHMGRDINRLCAVYNRAYDPILDALASEKPTLSDRVFFSKYEDLVLNPEQTQLSICAFCDISPASIPSEGNWRVSESAALFADHPKWRTYITELSDGPVSTASVGNYKSVLTNSECARIDELCQRVGEHFDYV